MNAERTTRYSSLLPVKKLRTTPVTVIGVGAIGRQVALMLATMGVEWMILYDPDTVGLENLGPQGYREEHITQNKARVTEQDCRRQNRECLAEARAAKWSPPPEEEPRQAIFCCVDNIDARKMIHRQLRQRFLWFGDARMAAESLRVIIDDHQDPGYYAKTIFPASEAVELPCTAKATYYCASIAAGLLVAQYTKWLRGIPADPADFVVNLLTMELLDTPLPPRKS